MSNSPTCPLCEAGQLHEHTEEVIVEYHGQKVALNSNFSVCDACGAEQATSDQVRRNKRAMIAFKKSVDGLLTGIEVRALREKLSINQAQAARIFGGGPVAFSKYESDDVAQSEAMDKLLRLAEAVPAGFAHLAEQAGVSLGRASVTDSWTSANWQSETDVIPVRRPPHLRLVSVSNPEPENTRRYA